MNKIVLIIAFLFVALLNFRAQVVINEVMINPQTNATSAQFQSLKMCSQSTNGSEYIELYNSTGCPIDISCFLIGFNTNFLTGINGTYRFPVGTFIPANGFLSIGGPNSGATINLYAACNTPNLNTDADRWFLPNGDGYLILWNASGTPIDAVFWTSNPGETSKWGTDSDISLAPTFIAQGTNCTTINSLNGPAQIPVTSAIVHYAGQSPTIGNVIHRVVDGGSNWATNAAPSINACNGTCNSIPNSFNLNASVTQPTCGNSDGVISFNPSPNDTYFFTWPFPTTGNASSVNNLGQNSYQISITNSSGCTIDTTIVLTEDCPTSTCNIPQLDAAMLQAGFVPLNVQGYPCAKYYYNPSTTNSWITASQQASAVGASLLSVCSQAENDAVWQAALAANITGGLWIGYTDQVTEGNWVWQDGSTCTFTNWNSGEPSNTSSFPCPDEDAAIIQMSNGRWNDVYLSAGICSPGNYPSLVKVNLCPVVTPTASALSVCEGDPVQLSGSTLFGSPSYTYTWSANNQNVGTGATVTVNPNSSTTYTVVSTDLYGCTATSTISITAQDCTPQQADICCPYVGWDYVQPIAITNNTPLATVANLQTLLVLDTQTPISQGKMLPSGNDIRFVYESCGNYLDYYIENGINTTSTNIWVKMPSIPANGSITLYWYYGNNAAPVGAVPFTGSSNSMFPNVITVSGSQNLSGTQTADWIEVPVGTTITMTNQQAVILNARKVNFLGTFNGNGNGYANQAGPGAGGTGSGSVGGGGGAYGGNGGGGGNANGGTANGTANGNDIDFGSGGGNSDCNGARGGGQLQINAHVVNLNGTVNVEGATVTNNCNEEAGGGGSGGGIRIITDYLSGNGTLNARGGKGQNSNDKEGGGGGSGGRIKIFHGITNSFSGTTNIQGGVAGTGGQSGMQPGQVGTVHQGQIPSLTFNLAPEVPVSIPTASFSATTVCVNNPTSFTNQSSVQSGGSVANLSWDFGNGNTAGFSQNPTQTYSSAGTYNVTLTVTSSTGCVDDITLPVTVNPGATASFTAQNVCIGNTTNFSNTSTGDIIGYVWSFGNGQTSADENPIQTYPTAGNYSVTLAVATANGCTAQTIQQVSVFALPNVSAGNSQTICVGQTATLNASGATTYVWTPNGTNGQPVSPAITTTYNVVGTDANGCSNTSSVNITVLPVPNAAISANTQVGAPGEVFTFTNNSSNGITYSWDLGNGTQTTIATTAEQTTSYDQVGLYTVNLIASNGFCQSDASLQVQIIVPELILFVPNVFTVNDDAVNDTWSIQTQHATEVNVQIFNRWGNLIKELKTATDTWDGKDATDGVYFYKYAITDNFQKVHEGHGFITLIKK